MFTFLECCLAKSLLAWLNNFISPALLCDSSLWHSVIFSFTNGAPIIGRYSCSVCPVTFSPRVPRRHAAVTSRPFVAREYMAYSETKCLCFYAIHIENLLPMNSVMMERVCSGEVVFSFFCVFSMLFVSVCFCTLLRHKIYS